MEIIKDKTTYEDILAVMNENFDSLETVEKKTVKAVETSSLPTSGKFVGYAVANPKTPQANLRLYTDTGESISIGSIQAIAHLGEKEKITFRKIDNPESSFNGKYISDGVPVNPHLSGNQARIAERLLGKTFNAVVKDGYTLRFVAGGHDEQPTMEDVVARKFYHITVQKR